MTRVIAVQEEQMSMLRENYKKNAAVKTVPMNNADVLNDSLSFPVSNQNVTPIDMETQVVNLDPSVIQPSVTSAEVTNEVFGPQVSSEVSMPVFPGTAVENVSVQQPSNEPIKDNGIYNVVDVPYQEPNLGGTVPNVVSDDSYYELLNSLRNMITDFANNAYAAIDKYQEEKLQGKSTGASLINTNETEAVKEDEKEVNVVSPVELNPVAQSNDTNIFDNQLTDLDNTVVIPGSVLSTAINEVESGMKLAA